MTTIAIVVGSVFAYVVVAGRVYRWLRETREWHDADCYYVAGAGWPVVFIVLLAIAIARLIALPLGMAWNLGARAWRLGAKPRRRSKLPEARVRR